MFVKKEVLEWVLPCGCQYKDLLTLAMITQEHRAMCPHRHIYHLHPKLAGMLHGRIQTIADKYQVAPGR